MIRDEGPLFSSVPEPGRVARGLAGCGLAALLALTVPAFCLALLLSAMGEHHPRLYLAIATAGGALAVSGYAGLLLARR